MRSNLPEIFYILHQRKHILLFAHCQTFSVHPLFSREFHSIFYPVEQRSNALSLQHCCAASHVQVIYLNACCDLAAAGNAVSRSALGSTPTAAPDLFDSPRK